MPCYASTVTLGVLRGDESGWSEANERGADPRRLACSWLPCTRIHARRYDQTPRKWRQGSVIKEDKFLGPRVVKHSSSIRGSLIFVSMVLPHLDWLADLPRRFTSLISTVTTANHVWWFPTILPFPHPCHHRTSSLSSLRWWRNAHV